MKKEYNKLVRDRIPEIIISNGNACKYRQANEKELLNYLKMKIQEELDEFTDAYKEDSLTGMRDELVDLLTVTLNYIDNKHGTLYDFEEDYKVKPSLEDFTERYTMKIEDKGDFKKGYILLEVEDDT